MSDSEDILDDSRLDKSRSRERVRKEAAGRRRAKADEDERRRNSADEAPRWFKNYDEENKLERRRTTDLLMKVDLSLTSMQDDIKVLKTTTSGTAAELQDVRAKNELRITSFKMCEWRMNCKSQATRCANDD